MNRRSFPLNSSRSFGKPSGLMFAFTSQFRYGSWGRTGARANSQQNSQEFIGDALDAVAPLEDRLVLRQIPLAHAIEPTQEVPHARPQTLLRVAVNLTHTVPVIVPRPGGLRPRVVHRLVDPPHLG